MPGYSKDEEEQKILRNKILGIGETSIRKSYYPQLQDQIKKLQLAKKRAEENEKKFSQILNSTSDGIVLIDPESGAIVMSNHTAQEMFEYQPREMDQLTLDYLLVPGQSEPVMARLVPDKKKDTDPKGFFSRTAQKSTLGRIPMQSKTCRAMICDIRTSFVEIEGVPLILALILDVTKLVTIEKEKEDIKAKLAHAGKMEALGTLAGGIAHDFNNILSGIFAYSQLAMNHLSNPEKAKHNIEQIQKAGEKAVNLIQQILSFARKTSYNKNLIPIFNVVKEALELLKSTLPTTIKIKSSIHSQGMIMADPTKIHQLMMNLCTNALHAMEETGGILTVELVEKSIPGPVPQFATLLPGNYIELTVSDTGHGMAPETMERIFEPYFTTKKTGHGTGFGLALVHGIVEDHKGKIFVESKINKGTCFHIFFPLEPARPEQGMDSRPRRI